jgi:hypothetical protein
VKATPTFEEAIDQFREFIVGQGWPESIIWRRPDEVVHDLPDPRVPYSRSKMVVLARRKSEADQWARSFYDEGVRAGVGVFLSACCVVKSQSCATIFWTIDERTAIETMLPATGLKLGCAVPRLEGQLRGPFRFRLARQLLDAYHEHLQARPKA